MSETARRVAAYHEAGHSVIGIVLGRRPTSAEILPGGGGLTCYEPHDERSLVGLAALPVRFELASLPPSTAGALIADLVGLEAGDEAQRLAGFDQIPRYIPDDEAAPAIDPMSDAAVAIHLAGFAGAAEAGESAALRSYARTVARRILAERWAAVERIAAALLERGRLAGDELSRLFDGPAQVEHRQGPRRRGPAIATARVTFAGELPARFPRVNNRGATVVVRAGTELAASDVVVQAFPQHFDIAPATRDQVAAVRRRRPRVEQDPWTPAIDPTSRVL